MSQCGDTASQGFIGKRPATPNVVQHFFSLDNLAWVVGKLLKHLHDFGLDVNLARRAHQEIPQRKGLPVPKPKTIFGIAFHSECESP